MAKARHSIQRSIRNSNAQSEELGGVRKLKMKYGIIIPQWSEGKPLYIRNIEADTPSAARAKVVNWVNKRAGYHYCDKLPDNCIVKRSK